jgi:hypothetical protein
MLNYQIEKVLIQVLTESLVVLRLYNQNCLRSDSSREKLKQSQLFSKVVKEQEVNENVVNILSLWVSQRSFIQLDKLEKSLLNQDYLGILLEIYFSSEACPQFQLYPLRETLKLI